MALKRAFDILISSLALTLLWPLFIVVGLMIRSRLGAPVLFVQTRPGLAGRPFKMIKFRTMLNETDAQGRPLPDERRVTPLGKLLRSTSLDELPELFNVLKGEMSLVGPRPLLMEYLPLYNDDQMRRHQVKPGITGWAQVNGRNATDWDRRFSLDLWYVDNRSFALDCKILLMTLKKVVDREGISQEGHATMKKFEGNNQPSGTGPRRMLGEPHGR